MNNFEFEFRFRKNTLSKDFVNLARENNRVVNETEKTITISAVLDSRQAAYYESGQLTRKEIRDNLEAFIK